MKRGAFVERTFHGTNLVLRVGRPVRVRGGFSSEVEVWIGRKRHRKDAIYGADSLQALLLALTTGGLTVELVARDQGIRIHRVELQDLRRLLPRSTRQALARRAR